MTDKDQLELDIAPRNLMLDVYGSESSRYGVQSERHFSYDLWETVVRASVSFICLHGKYVDVSFKLQNCYLSRKPHVEGGIFSSNFAIQATLA